MGHNIKTSQLCELHMVKLTPKLLWDCLKPRVATPWSPMTCLPPVA